MTFKVMAAIAYSSARRRVRSIRKRGITRQRDASRQYRYRLGSGPALPRRLRQHRRHGRDVGGQHYGRGLVAVLDAARGNIDVLSLLVELDRRADHGVVGEIGRL